MAKGDASHVKSNMKTNREKNKSEQNVPRHRQIHTLTHKTYARRRRILFGVCLRLSAVFVFLYFLFCCRLSRAAFDETLRKQQTGPIL